MSREGRGAGQAPGQGAARQTCSLLTRNWYPCPGGCVAGRMLAKQQGRCLDSRSVPQWGAQPILGGVGRFWQGCCACTPLE